MKRSEPSAAGDLFIPVIAEKAVIAKRQVKTGVVRITKTIEEHQELLTETLSRHEVQVETVPVGRRLNPAEVPTVRQEGEITIIPVLEEVVVVQKHWVLKEELRVKRVKKTSEAQVPVSLKQERLTVERVESGQGKPDPER